MNTSYRPQSRLMYQMPVPAAYPLPTLRAELPKTEALTARQLLDIELGLYLLSQLMPTAAPDALPALLSGEVTTPKSARWTARQHRYLNRARLLLNHFADRACWLAQLERYATGSSLRQAYVISRDGSWFGEKSEGFSRNRLVSLRQMLG